MQTLHSALDRLHREKELAHVAFSSIPLPASIVRSLDLPHPPSSYTRLLPNSPLQWYSSAIDSSPEDDVLVCFASSKTGPDMETWAFALPTVQGYFSGVGDLFSAMVLAHFHPTPTKSLPPLPYAVSKALLAVQQVLLQTHLYSLAHPSAAISGTATPRPLHASPMDSVIPTDNELDDVTPLDSKDPKRKAKRMRLRELRVVQERHLLAEKGRWEGKKLNWLDLLK
jgi:pyridoxine kinase